MVSLKDCFNNDTAGIDAATTFKLEWKNSIDKDFKFEVEITFKVSMPWISEKIIYFIYIPANQYSTDVVYRVMKEYKDYQKTMGLSDFRLGQMFGGSVKLGIDQPEMSDTLYIYLENQIPDKSAFMKTNELDTLVKELGITVFLREEEYRKEREKSIKLLAFISHDSRDKELIARPVAHALIGKFYNVWFDDYTLKIGDNLRESIERGIKESNKCILILTPNFLNNPGWTKTEFDSVFTKELIKKENLILPIWYNVTAEDIYEYSPSLANKVALHWPDKSKLEESQYRESVARITDEIIKQLEKHVA